MLGKDLMPWQRHVLDVALEINPETGLPAYREVVLTVPRQSGKTTSLLSLMIHRSLGFGRPQRITYTAQTRLAAREKWQYEHLPLLAKSPLGGMFKPVLQRGEERIVWDNGSIYGIESTTETAGHGNTLDLGIIDEAFARVDAAGEQAMRPAMITRADAQLWVVSTAGKSKEKSAYLWGKVKAGRERLESAVDSPVAYFEWSAPVDADPADPETWRACMPALGHTVTESAIAGELASMDLDEFRRAYLNQWLDDLPDEWDNLVHGWEACTDVNSAPSTAPVYAIDVSPNSRSAAIVAAMYRDDDLPHVEVVDHHAGVGWVVDRCVELTKHSPLEWVLDPAGPAGALLPDLASVGIEPKPLTTREMGQACEAMASAVRAKEVRHLGDPLLMQALGGAGRRDVGDGLWMWSRRRSDADIAPLYAATEALWVLVSSQELAPDDIGIYVF